MSLAAAWMLQKKFGAKSKKLVKRAIEIATLLPEPLSEQLHAILQVLGEKMLAYIQEDIMKFDDIPESKALKQFRAVVGKEQFEKGLAKGKSEGVILLLEARGFFLSEKQRNQILECRDLETLRKWLVGSLTAKSTAELLQM